MDIAYSTARRSSDSHRQVGAVIVKDDMILSTGFNGTPRGYHTNECKDHYGKTKAEVVHAEANAIVHSARGGNSTVDSTMYSTTVPCVSCAALIVQAGITKVYYREDYNKCQRGRQLLIDCNIELIKI